MPYTLFIDFTTWQDRNFDTESERQYWMEYGNWLLVTPVNYVLKQLVLGCKLTVSFKVVNHLAVGALAHPVEIYAFWYRSPSEIEMTCRLCSTRSVKDTNVGYCFEPLAKPCSWNDIFNQLRVVAGQYLKLKRRSMLIYLFDLRQSFVDRSRSCYTRTVDENTLNGFFDWT